MIPLSIQSLPWKWIGIAAAALAIVTAIVALVNAYGDAQYSAGQREERMIWEKIVEEERTKLAEMQRVADQYLNAQRDASEIEIENARKEVEDAVAEIPDRPTSDRQRARACLELMRTGQDAPACETVAAP